jgi:RNA polymerase sigma-54 factor
LEDALDCLQRFDPAGVGGRDLKEVLLLQVTRQTPRAELVRQLINNHLEDIQHNRLPAIQRRTGRELTDIREAIEALKHLNPKPGSGFTGEKAMALVPDVIIELQEDGNYSVRLKDDMIPNLRVNTEYQTMAKSKQTDSTTRDYLKRKVNAANWLQEAIEQRKYTLERVTRAIVERQKKFLDMGPEYIEPLKMQQIADDVGVHVTTISRAVDDKYAQTPRGIFPLKRFFGGGTTTASGEELAWEIIKRKLTELVESEDKTNPLSDEDLVERMGQSGVPIARRTITKYRKMLNIPSSRERREW